MALSRKKISLVHVARNKLGMNEQEYRDVLYQAAAVTSAADLDEWGFEAVMDRFRYLGFDSDFRARTWGQRAGMASPAQVELIRALWREYTDREGDDRSLGKWLDRTFKVSALRFLPHGLQSGFPARLHGWNDVFEAVLDQGNVVIIESIIVVDERVDLIEDVALRAQQIVRVT